MKKSFFGIFIMLMAICLSGVAYGGSIPEDLLDGDEAKVFFAEVVEYDRDCIKLIPVKVIRGDVALCEEVVFRSPAPVGDFTIKKGKAYLFTYYDENNSTYVLRSSSYDTGTLDLIDVEDGMWKRFESGLNAGEYEKAEAQRRAGLGLGEPETSDRRPPLHSEDDSGIGVLAWVIGGIGAVVTVMVVYGIKKRSFSA